MKVLSVWILVLGAVFALSCRKRSSTNESHALADEEPEGSQAVIAGTESVATDLPFARVKIRVVCVALGNEEGEVSHAKIWYHPDDFRLVSEYLGSGLESTYLKPPERCSAFQDDTTMDHVYVVNFSRAAIQQAIDRQGARYKEIEVVLYNAEQYRTARAQSFRDAMARVFAR